MTAFLAGLDARIFLAVYAAGGGAFTGVARILSAIGSGWIVLGLVPLSSVARWRTFALALAATLAGSAALVFILKAVVARPRPCVALPGVHALCALPTDPSFPSGHACGSFTFAAFVVLAVYTGGTALRSSLARAGTAAFVVSLAAAIAWSRVYLGVHFPGDVTAGAILGVACGALAGARYGRLARPRLTCQSAVHA